MLQVVRRTIMNPAEGVGVGTASPAPITFAASGQMMLFNPVRPVRVVRWGVILTTAPAGTGNLQFQGNYATAPNAGGTVTVGATTSTSGTGYNSSNAPVFYVDTAGGTLTLPSASASAVAVGSMLWHNVNPQTAQTGGYYPAPETALIPPGGVSTQLVIYPGNSFQIKCVSVLATTAGAGLFFLDLEEQAFVADFNNNAMVVTGYPSSNGTTPTPSWPFAATPFNGQS